MKHEVDAVAGLEFAMTLAATTGTIAAGNIVAAAAAASTQFALSNPLGSGVVLVLSKLMIGVISGTPPGGNIFHGVIPNVPTLAASGAIVNLKPGSFGSRAKGYSSAGGAALTGGLAPTILRAALLSFTATAQATVGANLALEDVDGDIVIPVGYTWLPLWSGAGTTLLNAYTITWKERPGI
jgi:hypothetical protein